MICRTNWKIEILPHRQKYKKISSTDKAIGVLFYWHEECIDTFMSYDKDVDKFQIIFQVSS